LTYPPLAARADTVTCTLGAFGVDQGAAGERQFKHDRGLIFLLSLSITVQIVYNENVLKIGFRYDFNTHARTRTQVHAAHPLRTPPSPRATQTRGRTSNTRQRFSDFQKRASSEAARAFPMMSCGALDCPSTE
jgi:hypothetical protein